MKREKRTFTPANYALMSNFVKNYGGGIYATFPDTESLMNTSSNVDALFNCY